MFTIDYSCSARHIFLAFYAQGEEILMRELETNHRFSFPDKTNAMYCTAVHTVHQKTGLLGKRLQVLKNKI